MSRLIENIIRNRSQQQLQEFDMSKANPAMMRYLGQGFSHEEDNVPIELESASWAQVQTGNKICLQKTFKLETTKLLLYFVNELIHLSEEMQHHPKTIIDHTYVTVTLYTRDLNDVTSRDIEMSKKIDDIMEDINIIKFR